MILHKANPDWRVDEKEKVIRTQLEWKLVEDTQVDYETGQESGLRFLPKTKELLDTFGFGV
jgi:hypothetical protein